ncbi:MAG: CDP-diacylglycerol--serine O-phosphatidyltransferase [Alphaproteobacteria bacterium]|nr:CDP-diacylglycerol--serine O-phosphatidyltransferase [Alphaproteobacteria bacterium]
MTEPSQPVETSQPKRLRRFRLIPMRFLLPNLVTLIALCLGLTSIRYAVDGRFESSVLAILAAAVLDGLDGRIARALEGATRFGAELDSLADFVDFGVAPAFLLYFWSLHLAPGIGWMAAMIFAIACALRLARFNVMIDDANKPEWTSHFFVGMPAPAGAIVAMLPIYLHLSFFEMSNSPALVPYVIFYVLFVAMLMASRIPHFSGKKIGRVPRESFMPVLFGTAVLLLLLWQYPMEILIAIVLLYLGQVPLAMRRYARYVQADLEAKATAEGTPEAG